MKKAKACKLAHLKKVYYENAERVIPGVRI